MTNLNSSPVERSQGFFSSAKGFMQQRMSVALCTYNGALYLQEQLDSLRAQTRLPDEMVICDDGSKDGTIQILQDFSKRAPFPVCLSINDKNLGVAKNYEKAISLCSGEIIALCDQDDIWKEKKLEKIMNIFLTHSEEGLVFSDGEVVDEKGRPLNFRLWEAVNFCSRSQRAVSDGNSFAVFLKRNVVTGAALAFRSQYKNLILPIPQDWVHDGWIALLIGAVSHLKFIQDPLIKYRQHSKNKIGIKEETFFNQWRQASVTRNDVYRLSAQRYQKVKERLKIWNPEAIKPEILAILDEKIAHLIVRAGLPDSRLKGIPYVLEELAKGHYHRYSNSWRSASKDLFLRR